MVAYTGDTRTGWLCRLDAVPPRNRGALARLQPQGREAPPRPVVVQSHYKRRELLKNPLLTLVGQY